jgi:hypothetical protein
MKSVKLTMATLLLGSTLSLSAADLTMVMSGMESGLGNIQKGFLYNSTELIQKGVDQVKEANKGYLKGEGIKEFLPDNHKNMTNIAILSAKRIDKASDELLENLKNKEMTKASESFGEIISGCTACHKIVRNW